MRGEDLSTQGKTLVVGLGAAELVGLGLGVHGLFFHRSPGEKLYDEFAAGLAGGAMPSPRVVAEAETKLLKLAAHYRFDRRLSAGLGFSAVALGTTVTVVNELAPYENDSSTTQGDSSSSNGGSAYYHQCQRFSSTGVEEPPIQCQQPVSTGNE